MHIKHIKNDKNHQIEKLIKMSAHLGFCMSLSITLFPVPPGFARTLYINSLNRYGLILHYKSNLRRHVSRFFRAEEMAFDDR